MTERDIQKVLLNKFTPGPYLMHLCNAYIFRPDWESDFYFQSREGVHIEVEIKISRGDFKKDASKYRKHKILDGVANKGMQRLPFAEKKISYEKPSEAHDEYWLTQPLEGQSSRIGWFDLMKSPLPNKFYYAAPAGLLKIEEIPDYSGFIEISGVNALIIKKAPVIHTKKYNLDRDLLLKHYWRYVKEMFNVDMPSELPELPPK